MKKILGIVFLGFVMLAGTSAHALDPQELIDQYVGMRDSGTDYGEQIINAVGPFAACSAIYEVGATAISRTSEWSGNWVEYFFGDEYGIQDLNSMSLEAAADFCVNTMGFNELRATESMLCPNNYTCSGDYMDAALGCMYFLMGVVDTNDGYQQDPNWRDLAQAYNGYINDGDYGMLQNYGRDAGFCIGGTFWEFAPIGADYSTLINLFENAIASNVANEIKTSYEALPQCAAIVELVSMFPTSDWWVYYRMPDGSEVPAWDSIDRLAAAQLCYNVFGFNQTRDDNPCPDNTMCDGTSEDAFIGCMFLMTAYTEGADGMSELADAVSEILGNEPIDYGPLQSMVCSGEVEGYSSFWDSYIPVVDDNADCAASDRRMCQAIDVAYRAIIDYAISENDFGLLTKLNEQELTHVLSGLLCAGPNSQTVGHIFSSGSSCTSTVAAVVDEYFDCWYENWDPERLKAVFEESGGILDDYGNVMNPGSVDIDASGAISNMVDDALSSCPIVSSSPLCPEWCWSNPVGCDGQAGEWGWWYCGTCPENTDAFLHEDHPSEMRWVGQCRLHANAITSERDDETGTFVQDEASCPWIIETALIF